VHRGTATLTQWQSGWQRNAQ